MTTKSVPSTQKSAGEPAKGLKKGFAAFTEWMKQTFTVSSVFVMFKYLSFIGFTGVSMLLSMNMFLNLSSHPVEQILLAVVSFSMEILKVFSIVRGNTLWQLRLRTQASRAYAMYIVLGLVSIMASYGFTLTAINRNIEAKSVSAVTLKIETNKSAQAGYSNILMDIDSQITINTERLKVLPTDYINTAKRLTDTLTSLEQRKADNQAKLQELKLVETDLRIEQANATAASSTTAGMFKLMAEGFKWIDPTLTETKLMLFVMLLVSVLIEIGIISTSPAIPIEPRHLKHILDDMSQRKAEAMLAGRKPVSELSLIGRVLQWWTNIKSEISSSRPPMKQKDDTLVTLPPSVSIRDDLIPDIPVEKVPVRKLVAPVVIAPVDKKEEVDVPLKPEVLVTPKLVDLPIASKDLVPPRPVAETKTYRFGKTTTTVKTLFVSFITQLFDSNTSGELKDPIIAAQELNITPSLTNTFLTRLLEIRGSLGKSLIEKRGDKYFANYTREYIVNYSTAELTK